MSVFFFYYAAFLIRTWKQHVGFHNIFNHDCKNGAFVFRFYLVAGSKSALLGVWQVWKNIWTICLGQVQQKCQNQCDKTVSSGPTVKSKYFIDPVQTTQGNVKHFHLMAVNYEAVPSFFETLGEI